MVNGSAYPLQIDVLESLLLRTNGTNFSQPVALLVSMCDYVPEGLLDAYYTPFDMASLALVAEVLVWLAILMWRGAEACGLQSSVIAIFQENVEAKTSEASADATGSKAKEEDTEARLTFFWIMQLFLVVIFSADYFINKRPYGTHKTGWQACTSAHFILVAFYKPVVAPLFICMYNVFHLFWDVWNEEEPPAQPKLMMGLAGISCLLFVPWLVATLIFMPVAVVSLIHVPIALLSLIALSLVACIGYKTLECAAKKIVEEEEAADKQQTTDQEAQNAEKEQIEEEWKLFGKVVVAELHYVMKLSIILFLSFYGFLPLMSCILYKDFSSWPRVQVLVWDTCVKMMREGMRFKWLVRWPDWNFDIDLKLAFALSALAAQQLQKWYVYLFRTFLNSSES